MSRIVLLLLLLTQGIYALQWTYTKEVSLSKDEVQTVLVREGESLGVLKFRWTLFAGDGLVMHLNYNGFASQFILYKQYKKESYKLQLLTKKSAYKRAPYCYLVFKKFDYKRSKAHFDILIDDPQKRTIIEVKPLKRVDNN